MATATLRERFFPLRDADAVDQFLARVPWCVIFKAGTSDKTFEAWRVAQQALEPRVDVAVGFIRLPDDRPASERVAAITGVMHRSPQLILFHEGKVLAHLDEFAIVPDQLVLLLTERLPREIGSRVRNEAVVTLEPYRTLLVDYLDGRLPEERFQWAWLDRLEKEAAWRDERAFALLNGLFENPWGRQLRAVRLVAHEFQGQLAGRFDPLKTRAARMLERLSTFED
jgi:bacillithiol system protein YtxJ